MLVKGATDVLDFWQMSRGNGKLQYLLPYKAEQTVKANTYLAAGRLKIGFQC